MFDFIELPEINHAKKKKRGTFLYTQISTTPQLCDAHYYKHKPSSSNYPNITTNQLRAIQLTINTNLSDLTLFVLLRD